MAFGQQAILRIIAEKKGFNSAISNAIKQLETLKGKIREVNTEGQKIGEIPGLAKLNANIKALQKDITILGKKLDVAKPKLDKLGAAADAAGVKTRRTGKRARQTGNDISAMSTKMQGGIDGFVKLAAAQTRYLASGIILFGVLNKIREGLARVTDVSRELARVMAVSKTTTDNFKKTQDELRNTIVRTSSAFGTTTKETADALYQLASAGLSVTESLAALQPVLNLAVGTNADFGNTAKTVAGIYTVFRDELASAGDLTSQFAEVTDVLTQAFRTSLVETQDLIQGLKFAAGTGAALGFEFKEIVAVLTALNNSMIKSGFAGRGFQRVMVELIAKGEEVRKSFGGEAIEVGNFNSVVQILKVLNEELQSAETAQSAVNKVMQIFGTRGGPSIIALAQNYQFLNQQIEDFRTSIDGAAEQARKTQLENLAGNLRILNESFLNFIESVAQPFAAVLNGIAVVIAPVLKLFREINEVLGSMPALIAAIVASATLMGVALKAAASSEVVLAAILRWEKLGFALSWAGNAAVGSTAAMRGLTLQAAILDKTIAALFTKLVALATNPLVLLAAGIGIAIYQWRQYQKAQDEARIASEKYAVRVANKQFTALKAQEETIKKQVDGLKNLKAQLDTGELTQNDFNNALAIGLGISTDIVDVALERIDVESELAKKQEELATASAKRFEAERQVLRLDTQKELFDQIAAYEQTKTGLENIAISVRAAKDGLERLGETDFASGGAQAAKFLRKQIDSNVDAAENLRGSLGDIENRLVTLINKFPGGITLFKQVATPEELKLLEDIISEVEIVIDATASYASQIKLAATNIELLVSANKLLDESIKDSRESYADFLKELARVDSDLANVGEIGIANRVDREITLGKALTGQLVLQNRIREEDRQKSIDRQIDAIQKQFALEFALAKDNIEKQDELIINAQAEQEKIRNKGVADRLSDEREVLDALRGRLIESKRLEKEAAEEIINARIELRRVEQENLRTVGKERLEGLSEEEKLLEVQSQIRKQLGQASGAALFDKEGLAAAEDAIKNAQSLLGELPTEAIKSGGKIIASEEEIASVRLSLAKKIALAQEEVARQREANAFAAQDLAQDEGRTVDQEITAQEEVVKKLEGQIKSLREQYETLGDKSVLDAIKTASDFFGDDSLGKLLKNRTQDVQSLRLAIEELIGQGAVVTVTVDGLPGQAEKPARFGGPVGGFGGGDALKYILERGEFVMNKEATQMYGPQFFDMLNKMALPTSMMNNMQPLPMPGAGGPNVIVQITPEVLKKSTDSPEDLRKLAANLGKVVRSELSRTHRAPAVN